MNALYPAAITRCPAQSPNEIPVARAVRTTS
jgi:hypothetical protein